jgi:hypothetical protein
MTKPSRDQNSKASLRPFNAPQSNITTPGFTEVRSGFSNTTPNVGTITHIFKFQRDPWRIPATSGALLCVFSGITLSIAKVFNPDNTTQSYAALSWTPAYSYQTLFPLQVTAGLYDSNNAELLAANMGSLNGTCHFSGVQSLTQPIDPLYFDNIASGGFLLPPGNWAPC